MTDMQYTILAYVSGLALLWGYALYLWFGRCAQRRRQLAKRVEG